MAYLSDNAPWFWILAGVLLVLGEIFGASGYLLVAGTSAIVLGAALFVLPEVSLALQFAVYAVLTVIAGVGWTVYFRRSDATPVLGAHGSEHLGRSIVLHEPIINGDGHVRMDDANWRLRCDCDQPAGTTVRIIAVAGGVLTVVPKETPAAGSTTPSDAPADTSSQA